MTRPLIHIPLLLLATLMAGCSSVSPDALPPTLLRSANAESRVFKVMWPGDTLEVLHRRTPELDATVTVGPDGMVNLPLAGHLVAAGRTPRELEDDIELHCAVEVRKPDATVNVIGFGGRTIHVGGEVQEPGVFVLSRPTTILESLLLAGGPLETAHLDSILLLRPFDQGEWRAFEINGQEVLDGGPDAFNVRLQPSDVIFVPRTRVANLNIWVDQYIRKNIPFNVALRPDIGVNN